MKYGKNLFMDISTNIQKPFPGVFDYYTYINIAGFSCIMPGMRSEKKHFRMIIAIPDNICCLFQASILHTDCSKNTFTLGFFKHNYDKPN